jgi:antibiotic biosynthesis monooxygenase (ABM) superfamily enzyme
MSLLSFLALYYDNSAFMFFYGMAVIIVSLPLLVLGSDTYGSVMGYVFWTIPAIVGLVGAWLIYAQHREQSHRG